MVPKALVLHISTVLITINCIKVTSIFITTSQLNSFKLQILQTDVHSWLMNTIHIWKRNFNGLINGRPKFIVYPLRLCLCHLSQTLCQQICHMADRLHKSGSSWQAADRALHCNELIYRWSSLLIFWIALRKHKHIHVFPIIYGWIDGMSHQNTLPSVCPTELEIATIDTV